MTAYTPRPVGWVHTLACVARSIEVEVDAEVGAGPSGVAHLPVRQVLTDPETAERIMARAYESLDVGDTACICPDKELRLGTGLWLQTERYGPVCESQQWLIKEARDHGFAPGNSTDLQEVIMLSSMTPADLRGAEDELLVHWSELALAYLDHIAGPDYVVEWADGEIRCVCIRDWTFAVTVTVTGFEEEVDAQLRLRRLLNHPLGEEGTVFVELIESV